jgi:DnaJ-domain-containing protein 1
MADNFALLDEPRRPWIDADLLKEKFLALSAQVHPDRVHQSPEAERNAAGQRYAELNSAYNCLRDPVERLRHLLELELGAKPAGIHRAPAEIMESFFEVGQICKEVDAFLAQAAAVTSPILKVESFERAQEWIGQLNALRQRINARREELLRELAAMNPAWESAATAGADHAGLPLERLEEIYRRLSYLARWLEQIQERTVQLSF